MIINETTAKIHSLLQEANRVVITSHIRPDGDAIGAVLGLGTALIEAGKQVQMVLVDGVPAVYKQVPNRELVTRKIQGEYDCAIAVDCSDLERTGGIFGDNPPHINIDHHVTNRNFAQVNWVQPEAAATCEILAAMLPEWGLQISQKVATQLLTGIVADTIGFRTSNTRPETLRFTAALMEQGASLSEVYFQTLLRQTYLEAGLWGKGLTKLQRQDRLVYTSLTLEDKNEVGYAGSDDADLINLLSTIDDVDIAIIFVELMNNIIKVSWRSRPGFDVSKIAVQFGGGGHQAASGAQIPGTLDEVIHSVLDTTAKLAMEGNLTNTPDHVNDGEKI